MTNGNGTSQQGALVRQDQFGAQQLANVTETASGAMAAQVKAAEEASYIMAMRCPRDLDQVRSELLRECARPSFAEVARYRKPIGQGIEGLSIRFVEQAMQIMGNIKSNQITVYDDDTKRIVAITVTDYEKNASHSTQITVNKTVERNNLRPGQNAIGRRTGSNGQTVYIVQATDDDLLNKQGSLVSKAIRTNGLRLIPGWLQDEADEVLQKTARDRAAKDPDSERRKLADAFAGLNISPKDLSDYLGHDLGKVSPSELVELRAVFTTIRDGQATWSDTIEFKRGQRDEEAPATAEEAKPVGKGSAAVKAKLAARVKPPAEVATAAPAETEAEAEAPARPSRSKAAQAERQAEVDPLNLVASKCLTQYVANGDPRNLAKAKQLTVDAAKAAPAAPTAAPPQPAPAPVQAAPAPATPPHDPITGEVLDDDEPDWMKGDGSPSPDEEF